MVAGSSAEFFEARRLERRNGARASSADAIGPRRAFAKIPKHQALTFTASVETSLDFDGGVFQRPHNNWDPSTVTPAHTAKKDPMALVSAVWADAWPECQAYGPKTQFTPMQTFVIRGRAKQAPPTLLRPGAASLGGLSRGLVPPSGRPVGAGQGSLPPAIV